MSIRHFQSIADSAFLIFHYSHYMNFDTREHEISKYSDNRLLLQTSNTFFFFLEDSFQNYVFSIVSVFHPSFQLMFHFVFCRES